MNCRGKDLGKIGKGAGDLLIKGARPSAAAGIFIAVLLEADDSCHLASITDPARITIWRKSLEAIS